MKQLTLGAQGPKVSQIGLGCMSIAGAYGPTTEDEAFALLDAAWEAGVTFYDTANIYGMGRSEEILGRWMADRRPEGLVLATKASIIPGPPRQISNEAAHLRSELEGSLKRLGVERVDLFYAHRRDPSVEPEVLAETMAALIREGKIGGYGVSEWAPASLRRAHAVHPVTAVQSEYSLWTRQPELGMLQACAALGVGFVPFSPVGRGMLTDRVQNPADYAPGDFRARNPRFLPGTFERNMAAVAPFRDFAAARGLSTATLAMAWVLAQGEGDLIPIPGTRSVKHLRECLAGAQVQLSAADLQEIERILPPGFAEGGRYAAAQTLGVESYG
ncbi:aldo/keto reductase [Falsigemmobacter intermedius]|uniref:Aldo/keto reductase n=1 Tax=Falsigemmobacter intermedius TaxID=1553448 RepID=A0A444MGS4_9RHOB|nr:aldo/keto reductase [Falsigemmobacter intermedius]RWY45535.1 aldo/keto reductase [Falsigemmobacter intermedius]